LREGNYFEHQKNRKILLLYESGFENTKKMAMLLSRGLEAGGFLVDVLSIQEVHGENLENYNFFAIGVSSVNRRISKSMKVFLDKIIGIKLNQKTIFLFEAKKKFHLIGSPAKKMIGYLEKLNLNVVHPIVTEYIAGRRGRLEDKTLKAMEKVGLRMAEKLNKIIKNNNKRR